MRVKTPKRELSVILGDIDAEVRSDTASKIRLGRLLIELKKSPEVKHGEFTSLIEERFDIPARTARDYMSAARYVRKNGDDRRFENIAPAVLYHLARDHKNDSWDDEVRARIIKAAETERIDDGRAFAIEAARWGEWAEELRAQREAEEPEPEPDAKEGDWQTEEEVRQEEEEEKAAEEKEAAEILDGPAPEVPPPEPATTDFLLPAFEQAIKQLKGLQTKPLHKFASTYHSAADITAVADFLHQVAAARKSKVAA